MPDSYRCCRHSNTWALVLVHLAMNDRLDPMKLPKSNSCPVALHAASPASGGGRHDAALVNEPHAGSAWCLVEPLPDRLRLLAAELPQELLPLIYGLPPRLRIVLEAAPAYVDRRVGADLLRQHVIPVSHRTLESWPLPWWRVNGRALTMTMFLFAVAHAKRVAAPIVMGGCRESSKGTERQLGARPSSFQNCAQSARLDG